MSEENIENITQSDSIFAPTFVDCHLLPDINFSGHYLINSNIYISKKVINLYISYTLTPWSAKPTKNTDSVEYKYSGYGLGFDSRSKFSFTDGNMGKMSLLLELIWAHLCILIIRGKIS